MRFGQKSCARRGSSWSRAALVMSVYLVLGVAALVWGNLRGQPDVWRLAGASRPWR